VRRRWATTTRTVFPKSIKTTGRGVAVLTAGTVAASASSCDEVVVDGRPPDGKPGHYFDNAGALRLDLIIAGCAALVSRALDARFSALRGHGAVRPVCLCRIGVILKVNTDAWQAC
jgi:hypothetical protein